MKQLLKNTYVDNLRVILRCDFNVPMIEGNITDESKIIKSLETINYLLSKNCINFIHKNPPMTKPIPIGNKILKLTIETA